MDHRLLRHLTWHALKQQHEFGKAPDAHRVEVSDGAADSDDSEGEEALPAEARRGLRSAWLLQAREGVTPGRPERRVLPTGEMPWWGRKSPT